MCGCVGSGGGGGGGGWRERREKKRTRGRGEGEKEIRGAVNNASGYFLVFRKTFDDLTEDVFNAL